MDHTLTTTVIQSRIIACSLSTIDVVYDFEGVASFPHFMSSLFFVQTHVYNSNIAPVFLLTQTC